MRLSELFEYLKYGELSQLSIAGEEQGVINSVNQSRLISAINLGMVELHKRFPIKMGLAIVQQMSALTTYHLDSRYAYTNPHNTDPSVFYKYIIDSELTPFTDDVLIIEAVSDENERFYTLNEDQDCDTIITTGALTINVPNPGLELALFVNYRAAPEKISNTVTNPEDVYIEIPQQYLDPLLSFVAHRFFVSANASHPEAGLYFSKFEAACKLIDNKGLRHKNGNMNTRLGCNGWL